MTPTREYRHAVADSRRRRLPGIGFRIRHPETLELTRTPSIAPDRATLVTLRESAQGQVVGSLELGVFAASLIIDRDATLLQAAKLEAIRAMAEPAAGRIISVDPVELASGAVGYRAEVHLTRDLRGPSPALPYVWTLALASDDCIQGGLLLVARTAGAEWPAMTALLGTLRIFARDGAAADTSLPADDDADLIPHLPMVGHRR